MDFNFAGDHVDRNSTTGCLFQLASGPMSWRSKIQTIVVISTSTAAYVAFYTSARRVISLKNLPGDFGLAANGVIWISEDN